MNHRLILAFAFCLTFFSTHATYSQTTTTWAGGVGLWSDASMWDNGIPAADKDVVVDGSFFAVSTVTNARGTVNSLTTLGGDTVELGASLIVNTTIFNSGTIVVDVGGGTKLTVGGDIDNQGLIELATDTFASNWLFIPNSTSLFGGGEVAMNGAASGIVLEDLDMTFINVDNTIRGVGIIGYEDNLGTDALFQNRGTIDADLDGLTIDIFNLGDFGILENTGTAKASGGGILKFDVVTIDNTLGTIRAEDNSQVIINEFFNAVFQPREISGGVIETTDTGTVTVGGIVRDTTLNGNIIAKDVILTGDIENLNLIRGYEFIYGIDFNVALEGDVTLTGGGEIQLLDDLLSGNQEGVANSFVNVDNTISGLGDLLALTTEFQPGSTIAPGFPTRTQPGLQLGDFTFTGDITLNGAMEVDFRFIQSDPSEIFLNFGDQDIIRCFGPTSVNGPLRLNFFETAKPGVGDFLDVFVADSIQLGTDVSVSGPPGYEFTFSVVSLNFHGFGVKDAIRAIVTEVPTIETTGDSFMVTRGTLAAGGVSEIAASDNTDLSIRRSVTDVQAVAEFEVVGSTAILNPTCMDVVVESSVFARNAIDLEFQAFNYSEDEFVSIGSLTASRFVDATQTFSVTNAGEFVDGATGEMKVRIQYSTPINRQRFTANIDHVFWSLIQ